MVHKCFYNICFDQNIKIAAVIHDFRWLKNCNLYNVWMDGYVYNPKITGFVPDIYNLYNTDADGSDGMFVFKLTSPYRSTATRKIFTINDISAHDLVHTIEYQASFMTVGKQSEYISKVLDYAR